jgi:putative FmdB family regulatory protein
MPIYVFYCPTCQYSFEEICPIKSKDNVVCSKCNKKPDTCPTAPSAIVFANPKGTSREDNFDYVARYNMERAKGERRAAEANNKSGHQYNEIDDMPDFEGKIV